MLRNFKKRKKFFSIILAFLFSMGSIAPLAEVYAKDYGDLSVIKYDSLREENHTNVLSDIRLKPIHKDNEGNEKTSYLTHEKVTVDVGFSTSNTTGKLDNTKFIITMPAEYIKLETPNDHTDDDGLQLSELQSADAGPDLKLIDENWVITYTYNSVPGGYSGDVPISIRTVMGDTPNGYKLPITVKVTDKNGNILPGGLIEKELTFNTKPPKHRKRVGAGDNILNNYENSVDKFLIGPAKDEEGNVLSGELGQNTVPEKHQPVNFRFDLYEKTRINKGVGARKYEKVVVEDKLPEGAVFIPSENPGWTEATNESGEKILRYEVNYPDGVDFNYNPTLDARSDKSPILDKEGKPVFLKLYFPGVKVRENNEDIIFTNSSTVELTPHKMKLDDKITKVTSDVKFKLETLVPSYKVSKIGPTLDVTDTKRDRKNLKEWSINIGNYTDLNFENLEINDFLGYHKNMNDQESKESVEELNLVKLKIFATDEKIFKGSFDIYAIGRDKSKKEIAKNVSITEEYNVDLPEDTVSVLFIATEGSVFYSQGYGAKDIQANRLNIRLYSVFKESQPKNVLKRERKYNSVKVIADSSKGSLTKYAGDFMYLAPVKREYKIEKSIVDEKGIYHIGNEVQFNLKAWFAHLYPGDKNDVVRIIDLLPEFTEYVKGSTTNTRDNRKILNGKELEPKVVENYMGLGKTALIWEFGPLEHNGDRPILGLLEPIHYNFDLNYKIKVNKGALGD